MASRNATIWIPSLLGVVFAIFGVAAPDLWSGLAGSAKSVALVGAVLLWIVAACLAFWRTPADKLRAGRGGHAAASGDDSNATGGRGGDAGKGHGGDGGNAVAQGRRSVAKGGVGGRG